LIAEHRRTFFFGAYEVSCRVRAERVKPYAPTSDSPRGPSVRSELGPPPPGATRELGVVAMSVANSTIYTRCQRVSKFAPTARKFQSSLPEIASTNRDVEEPVVPLRFPRIPYAGSSVSGNTLLLGSSVNRGNGSLIIFKPCLKPCRRLMALLMIL